MSITEIEAAIEQLPSEDVDKLMSWIEEFHARIGDDRIASDLESGRFDPLIAEAFESGEPTSLTETDVDIARRTVRDRIAHSDSRMR